MQSSVKTGTLPLESFTRPLTTRRAWFGVRLVLLCLMLGYIGFTLVQRQESLTKLFRQWQLAWNINNAGYGALLMLLGPVNWWLEARKWRLLAGKIARISTKEAFRGVLAGLSLGFVTPNTLGDYAARVWMLENRNRMEAIGAVLLGRLAQLYITLLCGGTALAYFVRTEFPLQRGWLLVIWLLLGILLAAGLYVAVDRRFVLALHRVRRLKKISRYLDVLAVYRPSEVFRVLGFALFRYAVFSFQCVLLLLIFSIHLPWATMLTGTSLVFLAKSVVPAFHFLSDLGVREFSSLYIFSYYEVAPSAVLAATLSLWLLNILLPALVGWLLLWRLKIRQ